MEFLHDEGQLGYLCEAALAEIGGTLIYETARLHRAVTGPRALRLGAEAFAELTAVDAEDSW
jgi:hypothetical protein